MQADTIKLLFAYTTAFVIVVGGGLILFLVRLDPPESSSASLSLVVAGFIGSAITFVFTREAGTQAARQVQSAANAAVAATRPADG